jgi:hypothetical protein
METKRVSIVCRMPGWEKAVIDGFPIYCLSSCYLRIKKKNPSLIERVYDLHEMDKWSIDFNYTELGEKLTLARPSEVCPKARVVDPDVMVKKFGPVLNSSLAWMVAEALNEQWTEIAIYGAPLIQSYEYLRQRPALYYLIGWGQARGMKVWFEEPEIVESDLYLGTYGFPKRGR